MKLSNGMVLAEWSHSGSFRAWFPDNDDKPSFMRKEYQGRRLRLNSDYQKVHSGYWVPKINLFIRRHTGIRV